MDRAADKIEIPIRNIYYLLLYAWNRLDESELIDAGRIDSTELVDLLARVLKTGTSHLLRRGLDRGYRAYEEATSSLKGRIDFATSLRKNLFPSAKAWCIYDDLTHDVLHNQILKSTLVRLARTRELDSKLRYEMHDLAGRIDPVTDIKVRSDLFRQLQLHKNNAFYSFLLNICYILHENLLPDESTKESRFRDFTRDDLARLFESFVRAFYKREQAEFQVSPKMLSWQDVTAPVEMMQFLPGLHTDITLSSPERTIVIDTKFYAQALTEYYGKSMARPAHINQIFVYASNVAIEENKPPQSVEGVLLYPQVEGPIDLQFTMHGHRIRLVTVDLNASWTQIHQQLLHFLI